MKKTLCIFLLLLVLLGCSSPKLENKSFKGELTLKASVIDIIEVDNSEYFYLLVEPKDDDHNSTLVLKSIKGQTKELFTKGNDYQFELNVIVDETSNRIEIEFIGFK